MTMLAANRQKLFGIMFGTLGVFAFALVLMQTGTSVHLLKLFNISYMDASAIVTAIITGTVSALPTSLQPLANALSGLVKLLYNAIGLGATIAF